MASLARYDDCVINATLMLCRNGGNLNEDVTHELRYFKTWSLVSGAI